MRGRCFRAVALLQGLLLAGTGCAFLLGRMPPRLADCPGPIPDIRELPPGDWRLRERVRVEGDGVDVGLDLAVEKIGDRLTMVGFHPLGAKAFSLVQEDGRVEVEAHLGRALQVPPENLLRDFHAAERGDPEAPPRVQHSRLECGYRVTFARAERADPASDQR